MDFLLASGRASAASNKPSWGSCFVPGYQDGTEEKKQGSGFIKMCSQSIKSDFIPLAVCYYWY